MFFLLDEESLARFSLPASPLETVTCRLEDFFDDTGRSSPGFAPVDRSFLDMGRTFSSRSSGDRFLPGGILMGCGIESCTITSDFDSTVRPELKKTGIPSKPIKTHRNPFKPIQTHSKPIRNPSKPIQTHSKPIKTPSKPIQTHSKPIQNPFKAHSKDFLNFWWTNYEINPAANTDKKYYWYWSVIKNNWL